MTCDLDPPQPQDVPASKLAALDAECQREALARQQLRILAHEFELIEHEAAA